MFSNGSKFEKLVFQARRIIFLQFENLCFQVKRTIVTTREPFPDVLQWFPILDDPEVFDMTPLDNAIEKWMKPTKKLKF
jgi:hypothetical protein